MTDVEQLLSSALAPVEPPDALSSRLERTLAELSLAAADELADWELGAMRDPRNWARPAAAAAVGVVAGGGLLVLRVRQRQRGRLANKRRAIERRVGGAVSGMRRRLAA